jgi:DNA ligase-1
MSTSFKALAELGEKLEATPKRLQMLDFVAEFLRRLESQEIEPAVSMILGRPFPQFSQLNLEVSWTMLSEIIQRITDIEWSIFTEAFSKTGDVGSATQAVFENSKTRRQATLFERTLTIMEVRRSFETIAQTTGPGSREKRERLVEALLSAATPTAAKYLIKIITGGMRTGFHEGLMEQAISKAFQVQLELVRKASMIVGDIGEVASKAKVEGADGLLGIGFRVFRPVSVMLAQMANDVAEALKEHEGKSAFEYKYDGARVQIHKLGDDVRIFSRRLTDVTGSLPEVCREVKANVRSKEAILEGEVVAVDERGNPIPFQHLMRRFRRVHAIGETAEDIPVKLYVFDVLYLDGKNLISTSYVHRRQFLTENAGQIPLAAQLVADNVAEAEQFLKEAMDAGHEGLMAKSLDSFYAPGVRGKRWLKIKPVLEPLDLVIVAAEYGYGRRVGWLSDYYLAARDAETGELLTVGKTFKGLTDAEIIEMTRRLKELAVKQQSHMVTAVPTIVVEVAYNEIQRSPKYKCGMALRFARITRIRDDKAVAEADTIQRVREIYERQFLKKGRYKSEQQR